MYTLFLFDVDGTLSASRQKLPFEILSALLDLSKRPNVFIGAVSGSDLSKLLEQFDVESVDAIFEKSGLSLVLCENGVIAYGRRDRFEQICLPEVVQKAQALSHTTFLLNSASIVEHLGEKKLQEMINYILKQFSEISLPCKRGNFVQLRTATLNVSPIGRNCSLEERLEFNSLDREINLRQKLRDDFAAQFSEKYEFDFALGGQISIDCYPKGWDKTYSLDHILNCSAISTLVFAGDKCVPGGNDYALYKDRRVTHPISVTNWQETLRYLHVFNSGGNGSSSIPFPHVNDIKSLSL